MQPVDRLPAGGAARACDRLAQQLAANDLESARALAASLSEASPAAAEVANAAIDAHAAEPDVAAMHIATLRLMAGDRDRALVEARAAAERDPRPAMRGTLGSLLVAAEQDAEAAAVLSAVVEETPDDRNAHINRATAAARLGDYGTAMLGYARAFDLDPRDRAPLHNLMAMFGDMGKWLGALAIVDLSRKGEPPPDVAVALDLVSIQLLQLVAAAYPSVGIDADADTTVKDLLINASKRGPRSQLAAARALCDIERFAEATKLAHNLARNPMLTETERADLHYVEGLLAEHDGYSSTAIDRYTRSLAADRTRADAATNAISLLLTDGTPPALAQIGTLLEQVDGDARANTPSLLFNQAIYLHRTGQTGAARDNLERVVSIAGDPEVLAAARQALAELGA